jgi:hypothetical protein
MDPRIHAATVAEERSDPMLSLSRPRLRQDEERIKKLEAIAPIEMPGQA